MKYLSFLIVLSFLACKPAEITLKQISKSHKKTVENNYQILQKTELIPNQDLKVVKDEWGKKYIKLLPGKHTVLKYVYTKKPTDETLMDAGYMQIVWFELGDKIKNKTYSTDDLQKNPVYVQITGFRNNQFIPVKNADVSIKIVKDNMVDFTIKIPEEYSRILKKDIHLTISINK